jgi:hypothetical protein
MGGMTSEAYLERSGDKITYYIQSDGAWQSDTLDLGNSGVAATALTTTDPVALLGLLNGLDVQASDASEPIDGKAAYKLSAALDLKQQAAAYSSQIVSLLSLLTGSSGLPADLPLVADVAIYVDASTSDILRVDVDLSTLVSAVLSAQQPSQPGMESAAMQANVLARVDVRNINAVADFTIPADAKAK